MSQLSKKEYTKILYHTSTKEVCNLSQIVSSSHCVKSLRPAQKTLTMIQMREPIHASLFYLGEALCCESMVEVDGIRGFSIIMGDDFEKATAIAIIDAAFTGNFPEVAKLTTVLLKLQQQQQEKRATENAEILKSKVDFHVMGE